MYAKLHAHFPCHKEGYNLGVEDCVDGENVLGFGSYQFPIMKDGSPAADPKGGFGTIRENVPTVKGMGRVFFELKGNRVSFGVMSSGYRIVWKGTSGR